VDQRGEGGRIRGTVWMLLARPDRVRFDAMTQLGPAATLTANSESFAMLDMRENRFLEGPSCAPNIARLLGVSFEASEVARFLLGDTPRIEGESSMACGGEGYIVEINGADGRRQELAFSVREGDLEAPPEDQFLRLMRSTLYHPDGRADWTVTFSDHQLIADPRDPEGRGVALPHAIHFEDLDQDTDVLVRYKSIDLLEEAPPTDVFEQPVPSGLSSEYVSCDG
jgi:hypothetical protein